MKQKYEGSKHRVNWFAQRYTGIVGIWPGVLPLRYIRNTGLVITSSERVVNAGNHEREKTIEWHARNTRDDFA